jgi:hypothetical protein
MKCARCLAENREAARFCRECGATCGAICSSCGAKVEAGTKFSAMAAERRLPRFQCPVQTISVSRPRSRTPRGTWPRRSSRPRARSKANASRSWCCSPISRARWNSSLTVIPRKRSKSSIPCSRPLMEAVHRYAGTVNQIMGDDIIALFGAPWRTRTTPSAPATPRSGLKRPWPRLPSSTRAAWAWASTSASGSAAGHPGLHPRYGGVHPPR